MTSRIDPRGATTGGGSEPHDRGGPGVPRTAVGLLVATPIVVLLTHYVAVIPHEFAHSITAWLLGIKPEPGDITWGGWSPTNTLLLWNINENVDYSAALAAGKGAAVALVGFAGPGLVNGGCYLVSRWLLVRPWFSARPVAGYVLFWFLWINLANVYSYLPLRTFSDSGDIHHIAEGAGVSPWWLYGVGGALVLWAMVDAYRVVLPHAAAVGGFDTPPLRAVLLILATGVMFAYYALPALWEHDAVSQFIGGTSILLTAVVLFRTWMPFVGRGSFVVVGELPSGD